MNVKKVKSLKFTKSSLLATFLLVNVLQSFATIGGKISGWTTDIQTALNAAVGVFAIVGGFIVFVQYMQGNSEAQKNFVKLCIGLGIFALSSLIVDIFITT